MRGRQPYEPNIGGIVTRQFDQLDQDFRQRVPGIITGNPKSKISNANQMIALSIFVVNGTTINITGEAREVNIDKSRSGIVFKIIL